MIRVLFENSFFLVISKPSGTSSHNEKPSVTDWLHDQGRPGHLVNRLDRETSGIMVIAKKPELHAELSDVLESGEKIYRALLCGKWKGPKSAPENSASPTVTWTAPLTDRAESRDQIQGSIGDQKPSVTEVRLIRDNTYFSEVQLLLLTGRQHQIRRHAALFGQAVVGDDRYGNPKYNQKLHTLYPHVQHRLQLHAYSLRFTFRGESFHFIDPDFDVSAFFI